MPIPQCSLQVQKPTPTTISFTVSTLKAHQTLPSRLFHYGLLILRVIVAIQIIITLYVTWSITFNTSIPKSVPYWLKSSIPFYIGAFTALAIPAHYLAPVLLFTLWLLARRGYTEESLVVLRGLGVQTTSSSPTYLSTASTRFIPTTDIQDIFIHEAFIGFEVRFYLAIIVEGEEEVVVVFPNLLPGRDIIEDVWRGTRECLYESKT